MAYLLFVLVIYDAKLVIFCDTINTKVVLLGNK